MPNGHDIIKHLNFLRLTLSQDKNRIGFFLSAGCPLAVKMQEGNKPLIPDFVGLTKSISEELSSSPGCDKNDYDKLLYELELSQKNTKNLEDILSFIRSMKVVAIGGNVRGFSLEVLESIEKEICEKIVSKLNVDLPTEDTPYHKLANWISLHRNVPVEIFTTNYDLLMEQALEELSIPYFDGFVGARQPFFDLRAVEEDLIPDHWTRIWKIHGSINWFQNEKKVFRTTQTKEINGSHLIYPSHLKYDQSRKMPYLALTDRLSEFIKRPNSVLLMVGYSFNDEHLNDIILNALEANHKATVIALQFGDLTEEKDDKVIEKYPNAVEMAQKKSNFTLWAKDEAIISKSRDKWNIISENDLDNNFAKDGIITFYNSDDNMSVCELNLGDYLRLGNFLQDIIGQNKFS